MLTAKEDFMLAHNAAASYSMNANFPPAGTAGRPAPEQEGGRRKSPAHGMGQLQRGAAGGVPLATVVFFNNLNVTPGGQQFCRKAGCTGPCPPVPSPWAGRI